MHLRGISDRAIIPVEGVIWRSCRFDATGAASVSCPAGLTIDLPPDLHGAGAKRRSEYLAGRLCAGLALIEAGQVPKVGRAGRAPVWPEGITGSITHSAGRASAVVSQRFSALGLDCETVMDAATLAEVGPLILRPQEWAQRPEWMSETVFATLAFSAKEAAYKAIAHRISDLPEFTEACIDAISADRLCLTFRNWTMKAYFCLLQEDIVALVYTD